MVNTTMRLSDSVLNNTNSNWSDSELLLILESEEFYRRMREKELTDQDKKFIREFISQTLSDDDFKEFLKVCLGNELDPYQEIREIIYSTYAKVLRSSAN